MAKKYTNQGIDFETAQDLRLHGYSVAYKRAAKDDSITVLCCSQDYEETLAAYLACKSPRKNIVKKLIRYGFVR